jgi:hypothetical protein
LCLNGLWRLRFAAMHHQTRESMGCKSDPPAAILDGQGVWRTLPPILLPMPAIEHDNLA